MVNLSDSLKNIIFDIYITAPFVFALVLGALSVLRNPVYLRRLSITFSTIQFCLASALCLFIGKTDFSFLNISFACDKFSLILIFLISFIFFIVSVISKTFILKSHKAFWSAMFLIAGLLNGIVLSDNIFVSFLNIVWIVFLSYFLGITFSVSSEAKQVIKSRLKVDIAIIGTSFTLILFDFLRYFILNDIEFCYLNIPEHIYHIHSFSIKLAFLGFLILILKLYNLIPFVYKKPINSLNPLVRYMDMTVEFIIASFLFYKTNVVFTYLYWDYQEIITGYLLINLVYYLILSVKKDYVYKFLNSLAVVLFTLTLFPVFTFDEKSLNTFISSTTATILSFSLLYLVLAVLTAKFKTDKFDEFKKIPSKNYATIFFTVFAILNLAGIPLSAMFSAKFITFTTLFSVNFSNILLSIMPYIIVCAEFLTSIILFSVFYNVLIAPVDYIKSNLSLSKHQITVFVLLSFCILIMGLFANNLVNGFN